MRTMCFNSFPALCIYAAELMGQISDGKYENRRPAGHWTWINSTAIVYDPTGKVGYDGWPHSINYNLNEWPKYITQGGEWGWANRILTYGRVGKAMSKVINQPVTYEDPGKIEDFVRLFEDFPWAESNSIEELKSNCNAIQWAWKDEILKNIEKYVTCGWLTDELIKEFYKTTFDMKELKSALKEMKYTVNHNL